MREAQACVEIDVGRSDGVLVRDPLAAVVDGSDLDQATQTLKVPITGGRVVQLNNPAGAPKLGGHDQKNAGVVTHADVRRVGFHHRLVDVLGIKPMNLAVTCATGSASSLNSR